MSLNILADQLEGLARSIPARTNLIAKDVAKTILEDLTEVTPVDTGEAVSNWQASIDNPLLTAIPAHAPSPRGRVRQGKWTHAVDPEVTRAANAPATLSEGMAVIESKQASQPIYLTNAVEHIEVLNDGSSDQVPSGFVDRAIILGKDVVETEKLL